MPNTVPAAAEGLPASRRSLLRGLAALPLAAVPAIAAALPVTVSAASPDAALIAKARQVEDAVRQERAACERWYAIEDRYDELKPKMPTHPGAVPSLPRLDEQSAAEMRAHLAEAAEVNTEAALAPYRARIARVEAYEAACTALRLRLGLPAAERLTRRWGRRMKARTVELTTMRPATLAGALAKVSATASVRATYDGHETPQWLDDITDAALRDVLAAHGMPA